MGAKRLSRRALNRATLERQLLLRRSPMPVLNAVDHLVGMQAQLPMNPYLGLWSRIEQFQPEDLAQLLLDRAVVRIVVMRGTIHLVTADDCLAIRPLMQPVLDGELKRHRDFAPALVGVDLKPVLTAARKILAERPRTNPQLRAALAERFPDLDAAALAFACRNRLALIQVPPRGVWGRSAAVTTTTAESWLGRPLARKPSIDELVLRYLAAYGPATVADIASWSRLTGMREVADRLEPRLRTFQDEKGRDLCDLPDAPRPDPDTKASARFLPEYDNVLLSFTDRGRFVDDARPAPPADATRTVRGTVLHDGMLSGTWRIETDTNDVATLWVDHLGHLTKAATAAIGAEGRRLLRFLATEPAARFEAGDVRFALLA